MFSFILAKRFMARLHSTYKKLPDSSKVIVPLTFPPAKHEHSPGRTSQRRGTVSLLGWSHLSGCAAAFQGGLIGSSLLTNAVVPSFASMHSTRMAVLCTSTNDGLTEPRACTLLMKIKRTAQTTAGPGE